MMTTYTMNGHTHSAMQTPAEGYIGMVVPHAARTTQARLRPKALPEKYSCLENPEPPAQLQAALKQIDTLLKENAQLRDTVLLLSQSISEAHSLMQDNESFGRSDRVKRQLLQDFYGCMKHLR